MGLVPRYATIVRGLNVVKCTCKGIEFCMTLLTKKMKYASGRILALYSRKQYDFWTYGT